ncbi:hypothetical protein Q427_02310 [Halomonas sp. BC04]|nr:hypothetical protein Q427_02310 [Halomonas sp. BC04]
MLHAAPLLVVDTRVSAMSGEPTETSSALATSWLARVAEIVWEA